MSAELPAPIALLPGLTLFLIRHGETDWNREARYQGQRDIPMNDVGRAQALRHGEVLREFLPSIDTFDFVASPLQRAIETMRIIRSTLGLDPDAFRVAPEIAELSYGTWEGELAAELPAKDPQGVAGKVANPYGWRPEGGESYEDLEARVSGWLQTVKTNTIAVSHGGVSRVARSALLGIDRAFVPFLEVPQDKILKIADARMQWI